MDDISLNIVGLEDLKKALTTLPDDVNKAVQLDVVKKAAFKVRGMLKQAVPEGNNNKATKFKLSDNVIMTKSSPTGMAVGFSRKGGFHSRWLEFGTADRKTKGKGKYKAGANRGRVAPHPFFQSFTDRAVQPTLDYISDNLLKIINQSLKRQLKTLS